MKIKLKAILFCLLVCTSIILSKKVQKNSKRKSGRVNIHSSSHKLKKEEGSKSTEDITNIHQAKYNGLGTDKKPLQMPVIAPDFNHDFQTNRNEFDLMIQNHGMSRFEGHMIFGLIDLNKDGALNDIEWTNFHRIFFLPFEECDKDGDYLINEKEVQWCLENTLDFRFLTEANYKEQVPEILDILQNLDKKVNFYGYLYMRRTALGWRECVPYEEQMSRGYFKCSMDIATMGKSMAMQEMNAAFGIALKQNGLMMTTTRISYANFLRLTWAYNLFISFDQPITEGKITQREFERGMDENIIPVSISPDLIRALFKAIGSDDDPTAYIKFPTFVILHMWWSKYHVLAGPDGYIGWEEFCNLISQKPLKYEIIDRVDQSVTGLSNKELEKASLAPDLPDPLTEKDYILFLERTFKKTTRKSKKLEPTVKFCGDKKDVKEVKPNEKNRRILYNIVDVNNDGKISYGTFILFLKFSYSFAFLDHDQDGRVNANEIFKIINMKEEAITMVKKETDLVHAFLDMDIHAKINILQWLAYCFADQQMANFVFEGTKHIVTQEALTTVLDQVDLHIIPKDLQYATLGIVGRPNSTYNYMKAYRISLQTHARATTNYWWEKRMAANKASAAAVK